MAWRWAGMRAPEDCSVKAWNAPGASIPVAQPKKKHPYGTLDNVPEFATRSVGQLYSLLFERFEGYDGTVIYGPRSDSWPSNGYWGRKMVLHTQETLQVRFWPKDLLGDGDKDPHVIRIFTKVSAPDGNAHMSCFVGFQKAVFCNEENEIKIDMVQTQSRIVGCRGLHIFMASLFKRHNTPQTCDTSMVSRSNYDRFGYESLRSTTYSVYNSERKNLEKTSDHQTANASCPGVSMLMVAGELVDVHLEPIGGRVCQPISHKKWKDHAAFIKTEILQNPRGETAGIQAIGAATCIVDQLSAEGLVSMLASPLFEGALPDRIAGPHGMSLIVAMAVNLALRWSDPLINLPRPSQADMAANDQLRMILHTSGFGPLPGIEDNQWCIDVVTRGALNACVPEVDELKRQRGLPANAKLAVMDDTKCFWQRVGQRLITIFFGLGCVCPRQEGGQGTAWRVADPLQLARDKNNAIQGCMIEGVYEPVLPEVTSFGARKQAFVKMLQDVERWLRCGQHAQMELTPRTSPEDMERHLKQIRMVLGDMMAPKMVQDLVKKISQVGGVVDVKVEDDVPYDQSIADKMCGNFHLPSMGAAIEDCKEALLHGPSQHFKYLCGAYVVASTQTSPCCDCLAPVHVLQGTMLANAYGECSACHAKRCISCTEAYAKAVRVEASQAVGKRCRICGADPAFVTVQKAVDPQTGEPMMQIHLGERVPAETNGNLLPTGVVHATSRPRGAMPPPAAVATKRKGKKSKKDTDARAAVVEE
jgi:hypothetical protein